MTQFKNNGEFVKVPKEFIKTKLPDANPTFVKVYLYLLMLSFENASIEYSQIANRLGILESDLLQAINYWISEGEITQDGNVINFSAHTATDETVQEFPSEQLKEHHTENIADIVNSDKSLSDLIMISQEILGKTITERDMETIYWFYSGLEMPPEVILLLLEYCVSKGKNRLSYLEKVAISWKEMGLNTSDTVTAYIKSEEHKNGFLYSIRKVMGISDRALSQTEEKYLEKWHHEWNMSEEMIALAYEYCIIQTAKLSFPYMDKIITRWKNESITTPEAAEEDNKKFRSRSKPEDSIFKDKYDHDDLEKFSRN